MASAELSFLQNVFRSITYIGLNFLCAMPNNNNGALASGRFYCIKHVPYHRLTANGVQHLI
ncbi:hypothetical protein D3C75_1386320 [compost metagenome]